MNTLNRQNPLLWLGLLLLAWLVLGVQLAAPKVASGPFYAATEHHLGVTRWEAAPRLGLDAWTTNFASGDTVGAKATGAVGNAERGVLGEANFAQNRIKSDRSFSLGGQKIYSELAGRPIKTVDDLASALKAGSIKPSLTMSI